jgi:hypothetical protein
MAATLTGTTSAKMLRQPAASTSSPPMVGPTASARPLQPAQMPIALARCLAGVGDRQNRERGGDFKGGSDPGERAPANEHHRIGRDRAHDRAEHDQADADGEDAHPAIQVAERAAGEQERGVEQIV